MTQFLTDEDIKQLKFVNFRENVGLDPDINERAYLMDIITRQSKALDFAVDQLTAYEEQIEMLMPKSERHIISYKIYPAKNTLEKMMKGEE